MKERPIPFSAPMVRALLAGTKTQTRRVVQSSSRKHPEFVLLDYAETGWWPYLSDDGESSHLDDGNEIAIDCPYGQRGDRLWVRETSSFVSVEDQAVMIARAERMPPGKTLAQTDGGLEEYRPGLEACEWAKKYAGRDRWHPSIHMPRWASRITLEVVAVRVERLQDISEADAQAEGVERIGAQFADFQNSGPNFYTVDLGGGFSFNQPTAKECYAALWDQINGPGSWEANPWVWVVEFKRITT